MMKKEDLTPIREFNTIFDAPVEPDGGDTGAKGNDPQALNKVRKDHRQSHRVRGAFAALLMVLPAVIGTGLVASPADAAIVRPGANWGQVDLLLDSYETEAARRSFWGATVICWDSGAGGKLLAIGVCQSAVSVCAAQAYYATPRTRAGMTFTPWGQFWCWKY